MGQTQSAIISELKIGFLLILLLSVYSRVNSEVLEQRRIFLSILPPLGQDVKISYCNGTEREVVITCEVKGLPDNSFVPRIDVGSSDGVLEKLSHGNVKALQDYGITPLKVDRDLLQFKQVISDAYNSDGMTVCCELQGGQIKSSAITYERETCISPPTFLDTSTDVNPTLASVHTAETRIPEVTPQPPESTIESSDATDSATLISLVIVLAVVVTGILGVAAIILGMCIEFYRSKSFKFKPRWSYCDACSLRCPFSQASEYASAPGEGSPVWLPPEQATNFGDLAPEHQDRISVLREQNSSDNIML